MGGAAVHSAAESGIEIESAGSAPPRTRKHADGAPVPSAAAPRAPTASTANALKRLPQVPATATVVEAAHIGDEHEPAAATLPAAPVPAANQPFAGEQHGTLVLVDTAADGKVTRHCAYLTSPEWALDVLPCQTPAQDDFPEVL